MKFGQGAVSGINEWVIDFFFFTDSGMIEEQWIWRSVTYLE